MSLKHVVAVSGVVAGLLVPAVPAVAGGTPPPPPKHCKQYCPPKHCKQKQCPPAKKPKCNAGRGNGSEIVMGRDCDPGNSGGRNQGGD